jgi:hypothetical protein
MVSIDNRALGEMVRVLDARAYAAQTQIGTATFDNAIDRLIDIIDQAEPIELYGRPGNIDPPLWQEFQIALARAIQMQDTLWNQLMDEDPEDDWETFTGEDISRRFIAREPTTSGTPDVVGTKTTSTSGASSQPAITSPAINSAKSDAIDSFRVAHTLSNAPAAPWYTSPMFLGLGAAGLVGLFYLVRK